MAENNPQTLPCLINISDWKTKSRFVLDKGYTLRPRPEGDGGADGVEKLRIGNQVSPLEKTYEMALDPELHAKLVAEKYGINLKSGGQEIKITYDPNLYSAGKVKAIDPNTIILGPSAYYSEVELANTIAHELNHSRAFINGIPALEPPAYNAGDSLADYINGGR